MQTRVHLLVARVRQRDLNREDVRAVRAAAEEAGRDPDALTYGMGGLPRLVPGGEEETARALRSAAAIGVQHGRIGVEAGPGRSTELIAAFARDYLDDLHDA